MLEINLSLNFLKSCADVKLRAVLGTPLPQKAPTDQ